MCDGQPNEPTCKANADAKASRRDFILVNDILYDAVKGFRVMKDDLFPTHRPVQVCLDLKKLKVEKRTLRKPRSAAEAFEERIEEMMKENKDLNENEVRRKEKDALHQAIDEQISLREWRMSLAVNQSNADKLWDLIAAAIENGFTKHFGLVGEDASKMRGRNVVRIRTEEGGDKSRRMSRKPDDGQAEDNPGPNASDRSGPKKDRSDKKRWLSRAGKHATQANRLINVARRMKAPKLPVDDARKKINDTNNRETMRAYFKEGERLGYAGDDAVQDHPSPQLDADVGAEEERQEEKKDGGKHHPPLLSTCPRKVANH